MRLIDADSLREWWLYNGVNEKIYDTNDFLDSIDDEDTVEPCKTGEWIDEGLTDASMVGCYTCSICFNTQMLSSGTPMENGWKHCPVCGNLLVPDRWRAEREAEEE